MMVPIPMPIPMHGSGGELTQVELVVSGSVIIGLVITFLLDLYFDTNVNFMIGYVILLLFSTGVFMIYSGLA